MPGGFAFAGHRRTDGFRLEETLTPDGRRPRQPHPGTRIIHYRCFLPDLAGFADYRRGGTDGATMDVKRLRLLLLLLRQLHAVAACSETGGEGGIRTRDTGISRIHTFQACSFNHSDTSPHKPFRTTTTGGIVRPILGLTPRRARGQPGGCPNSFPTNLSNPRYEGKPYTHFPGVLLQPLGHLSARKTLPPAKPRQVKRRKDSRHHGH